ncbi:hypothetical protein AMELA_G00122500 [Ameiurus melas]|uniref:Uncharacterized protein n=1 Tax=Ameiurus melas TaxID=219545 RepID=A0A7J6AP55_AMEME|nr:hypothetical protein AMELA_G00122500 [Ameiurus melas]
MRRELTHAVKHQGIPDFHNTNWEGVVEKVCAKLSQWTWVQPQLSYRVLGVNTLIVSMLWHHFTALEPPAILINEDQKRIVNNFWAGQHWTHAGTEATLRVCPDSLVFYPEHQQDLRTTFFKHQRRAIVPQPTDTGPEIWQQLEELCVEVGLLLGEVVSALPSLFNAESLQPPSPLRIFAAVERNQREKGALLTFQTPILTTLEDAFKKALYGTCFKVMHRGSMAELKES